MIYEASRILMDEYPVIEELFQKLQTVRIRGLEYTGTNTAEHIKSIVMMGLQWDHNKTKEKSRHPTIADLMNTSFTKSEDT